MKSDGAPSRIAYIWAVLIIMAALIALRFSTISTKAELIDVRTSSLTIEAPQTTSQTPLFVETAAATTMMLSGFSIGPPEILPGMSNPMSTAQTELRRLDVLHLKDFRVAAFSKATITYENDTLSLVFDGPDQCCEGRIGVGSRFSMKGGTIQAQIQSIHAPNLSIRCQSPPCSISIHLLEPRTNGLVENWKASSISFFRPGTSTSDPRTRESGIKEGAVSITGIDLLGGEFVINSLELRPGASIEPSGDGATSLSVDVQGGALVVNGVMTDTSRIMFNQRAASPRNIVPTALEFILREPWRPSLLAIIMGGTPLVVAAITRYRRRSKR